MSPIKRSSLEAIRPDMAHLPPNMIREIADLCFHRDDVTMLCFGESDDETPRNIKDAAAQSLAHNDTFYTPNSGVPELRHALADYMRRLYSIPVNTNQITVTASGMSAIMLVMQAILNAGDEVVVISPIWPNVNGAIKVLQGKIVDMNLDEKDGQWSLDLNRLFARCTKKTRAIFLNAPNNPTGWCISIEEQHDILMFCRQRGIWLICDDVYARLTYAPPPAPSFLQIAEPDDLLIAVNSFSKTWSMTGWRLGWLTAPAALLDVFAKLNEFNVAAPTTFVQYAGIAALATDSDPYVTDMVARLNKRRDLVVDSLVSFKRVRIATPPATFYTFFAVDGVTDSLSFAKDLLKKTGVALAPGRAFGEAGEGYLRLCFAKSESVLSDALQRIRPIFE